MHLSVSKKDSFIDAKFSQFFLDTASNVAGRARTPKDARVGEAQAKSKMSELLLWLLPPLVMSWSTLA